MNYWWVNQGQTYAEERAGQYLWSPKRNRNGARNPAYDRMPEVAAGDGVFHYAKGFVRSYSDVVRGGYAAEQPAELKATDLWDDDGWRVDVIHRPDLTDVPISAARAIDPSAFHFQSDGKVKLAYLFELDRPYAERLAELASVTITPTTSTTADREPAPDADGTRATTVPLEAGDNLEYEQTTPANETTVSRSEWSLVQAFVEAAGVAPVRRRYALADGGVLYADLWLEKERILVEAKASAGRGAVREAIGQLADYAQKESGPVRKLLLLPTSPSYDLLAVLHTQQIVAVWPDGHGVWARSDADKKVWTRPVSPGRDAKPPSG